MWAALGALVGPASAGADQGRPPDLVTSAAERGRQPSGPAPLAPRSSSSRAQLEIPRLSPDPGKLRRAKARAAEDLASDLGTSPRLASPFPKATVFGGLNKPGMAADEFSGTPPDTTGAIGPSHYVEFVNSVGITVYDRSNLNPVAGPVTLEDFIGFPSDSVFDPQIQWDQSWGRWIYVMDDLELEEIGPGEFEVVNRFLALGWSKTADPTNLSTGLGGGWCGYFLETGPQFDDYPKLGHSNSGITIGTNVFGGPGETFQTSRIWSIAKPPSPAACPPFESLSVSLFGTPAEPLETANGDEAFTPVPANTADSSPNSYVVAADSPFFTADDEIMAWHVSGAGAGATLVEDGNMSVGAIAFPANVPQEGTTEVLDSLDARLTNAVAVTDPAVGKEAVWTQHTVDSPGGRSVVRWYELLPDTQTVRQEGTISDPTHFVFNGAISPTKRGDAAAIDFNRGSATLFPDMHAQSRHSGTPLGQMEGDVLLGTSTGAAADFSCEAAEPCRWGDYASASPDPSRGALVWGSSQGLAAPLPSPNDEDARWTTRNFALIADSTIADSTPPAAPAITATDPASPANDNNPKVKGSAEAGSTVRIYESGDCSGPVAAQGSAAAFASVGLAVTVPDNQITPFTATATDPADNTSPCSGAFAYIEDSTAATPSITGSDPASPANDNNPELKGIAEAGSTVRLFASADCSGPVAAQGSAAAFALSGLTVAVADNQTTQFTATATDLVGNTSPCSGAFAYTESTPAVVSGGGGGGPGNGSNPPASAAKVALVQGGKALLRMSCPGPGPCQGTVRLVVQVKSGERAKLSASAARVRSLVIGRAKFSIAGGKSATVRVPLTSAGLSRVRKAGKRGLPVKLRGSGVVERALKLKPAPSRKR